ncbi:Protein CBG16046 [Caenorhabditis briggsae]|uniref:Protein CBG16046 n=1 Tax=Caenorhabditis briggsae TaxID=6238 RepID=A8XN77_CAEBR|nr:Protein CBG16046 [Caenorhabditis briggsae]CAP34308.2 Protein CBG16046 [Caenorhabditis briggsae]
MQSRLDAETASILENGKVLDENSLKKKTFLMNMFRTAVLKVMTEPAGDDFEGEFSFFFLSKA